MGTVVAVETDEGVVIAGDRRTTRSGTVTGNTDRVLDLNGTGAGVAGDVGDVDSFSRRLVAGVDRAKFERSSEITIETLARIAARVAEETGVDAVVATRNGHGIARLREVTPDGAVLSDPLVALGSGAQLALGRLETVDRARDLESTAESVRDVLEIVSERDPNTGDQIDLWSLENSSGG